MLGERLILFHYILKQFGFNNFDKIRDKFSDNELKADTPDNSVFYTVLSDGDLKFPIPVLKSFDDNINAHLEKINRHRNPKISLKYYQYFSLLFTEYYLHQYFTNNLDFIEKLNEFKKDFYDRHNISAREFAADYDPDNANLIAYWNATGSGKTFILHFNVLQYRHYCKDFRHLILLTPSEQMSKQHLEDLRLSGIDADYYVDNKEGSHVKVIDIHKIRSQKGVVTVSVDEFQQNNALFVDEGHKGNDKEEGVWRGIREKLGYKGFTFEYSATFGQISNQELQKEYSRSIIFDYSYRHFFRDGYGKDYWIHNISDNRGLETKELRHRYLLHNLLLFTQQKLYYDLNHDIAEEYQIENPLLIFVGHTVNQKATAKGEKKENEITISDVKLLINFFAEFLSDRQKFTVYLDEILKRSSFFSDDYKYKHDFLFDKFNSAPELYNLILRLIFNSEVGGVIELLTIRNAPGEIALKVHNSDFYFGLINIGDTSAFKSGLKEQYKFDTDVMSASLFEALPAKSAKPLNILIGARKFIEGWNSYRVSSIGLINFGRAEGSQIIQLFGRGVRLKGKEDSLKRTDGQGPPNIRLVETLNIFGLNADYMKRFKEDLEKEGIKARKETIPIPTKLCHENKREIDDLGLITLEAKKKIPPFHDQEVVELLVDDEIKVELNYTTQRLIVTSDQQNEGTIKNAELNSFEKYLPIINIDRVYLDLLEYKRLKQYYNLTFKQEILLKIITNGRYSVILDEEIKLKTYNDIAKISKLVLSLLKKYLDTFYNRHQRVYTAKFLESKKLKKQNSLLDNTSYEIDVITTDEQGNALENIEKVLSEFKEVIEEKNYPENLKHNDDDVKILNNAWFDYHLYQPLLIDADFQSKNYHIDSIVPKGLNEGEFKFVRNLQTHIKSEKDKGNYKDMEFYLLRNSGRNKGLGFYFSTSGGFYPDFLFWIKKGRKQYLTFIDPHGLRNEDNGFESDKIQLHKKIKELEKSIDIKDVVLNSIIISPKSFKEAGIKRWKNAPQDDEGLIRYCNLLNVYEMGQYSTSTGDSNYIGNIIYCILK
ncbi:MAG: DEAD/DEAH box helicase family protein [Bacteroidales bacterium]|nr:DEAD/DEAH box helicase family protein [Bacteroidales bacterium]MCF8387410.1 DEAD/DEAH box helicase family protein [Bacteroidales bacterium]MCF8397319.1 DEAD/DEAH box helicase family protein [Bacteroidales bacterium]